MWFTEFAGNQIGRVTTAGVITEYPLPTAHSEPGGITTGPDGELWFAQNRVFAVGEAVLVTAGLSVSPDSGVYHEKLTFTGSTFAPNEAVQIYASGVGSGVLATAAADASGAFTATTYAPSSPNGPRLFLGQGRAVESWARPVSQLRRG